MKNLIFISKLKPEALSLAFQIVEKEPDSKIVLISDAAFLLSSDELIRRVETGVFHSESVFVLEDDLKKRGLSNLQCVSITSYEVLVDMLFEPDIKIVNL